MLIDLLHIFWSYLKQITWLYGTVFGIWAIFGLRVIWRTMILAIMKSESGGKLGLRLDREWEWILHRLYKQSLHNMYFDSICFMFATFEEGLMNPFNILKRWSVSLYGVRPATTSPTFFASTRLTTAIHLVDRIYFPHYVKSKSTNDFQESRTGNL